MADKTPPLAGLVPFLALIVICVSIAFALDIGYGGAVGMTLHSSLGFLLCSLAILKLFDLRRFVDGFAGVDLVARSWRGFTNAPGSRRARACARARRSPGTSVSPPRATTRSSTR